jgi:uncharacterized membrane protein YphA (DoxX/SURF4 family)
MFGRTIGSSAVATLILRLTLAVIFLYHGLTKIGGLGNELGANWLSTFLMTSGKPREDLAQKFAKRRPYLTDAERQDIIDRLNMVLATAAPDLPTSAQSHWVQLAVAWGEFLAGLALLAGLLTRVAAAGVIIIQIGAVVLVTAERGFSFTAGGGYEYNVALIGMALAVLVTGAGVLSVDSILRRKKKKSSAQTEMPTPLSATTN